jgi:hypothetical protein
MVPGVFVTRLRAFGYWLLAAGSWSQVADQHVGMDNELDAAQSRHRKANSQ